VVSLGDTHLSITHPRLSDMLTVINSLVASLFVYLLLSYISVTQRVSVPVSIFMFTLMLGLTRYYSKAYNDKIHIENESSTPGVSSEKDFGNNDEVQENYRTISTLLFSVIFAILIIVCIFNVNLNSSIFISWNELDAIGVIQLGVGIALSFFLPGYALLLILSKVYKIGPLLRFLLTYLFSMLITGLTAYVSSSFSDFHTLDIKTSLVIVNLSLLIAFLFCYRANIIKFSTNIEHTCKFVPRLIAQFWTTLKTNSSELLVFASLLGLLTVSTFYLYGGITIGDQWFHQGRALLFMSGWQASFSSGERAYPPFQSALLAGVTSLSGVPLVNTYASIAFLNLSPVIAFYYFFSRWIPRNLNRANLLACSLFAIGSGFNWIYFLGPMGQLILSGHSFLEAIYRTASVVVVQPTNFIFAANPDFSTGLIYIALPAGFVLLGLVHERIGSKLMYTILTTGVTIVGSLTHPEFYYFIIVGSLLPIFFSFKKEVYYLYLGFLFALTFVYLFDKMFPGNASIVIFGLPLVLLGIFFILCAMGVFMTRQILSKRLRRRSFTLNKFVSKLHKPNIRSRFLIAVVIVSVVTYMYGLSLIISTQSSIEDLKIQTAEYSIPWFFYAIKLGIIGCLGLVFILSYLFRRFENEIFVFGVIILVAMFVGSYYDQHRFSKFIMVGMIGFASLLVYKILNVRYYKKIPLNTFIIPSLIICASISVLLFIGYNSLVVQTHDYSHNPKKNFPSLSEIRLFDVLRNKIDATSNKFNVVSLPDEYKQGHLITRLQAFSGFSSQQIYTSPLTLNTSTLDSFYRLLDYTNAKYIVMPKSSIINGTGLSEPARFALIYFPIVYNDDNYTVLEVPPLKAPSTDFSPDVALIYEKDFGLLPSEISNKRLVPYNKESFTFINKTQFVNITKDNQTERIILYGNKRDEGITVWSKDFKSDQGINYAQVKFRIISENEEVSNDAGLQWKEGRKQYYASISRNGLTVSQKKINDENSTKIEFHNSNIENDNGTLHTLRIESLINSINVYVDDILKIQIPRTIDAKNFHGMSNIGIGSFHNIAEFGPLEVGNSQIKYDKYYYPLSALALSKANYDTYIDGDMSVVSKKIVVLPFDPVDWNDRIFNNYLAYVNQGGKLIIIDSDNIFNGRFSKLFLLESNPNQTVGFRNILENNNNHTLFSFSGIVNPVHLPPSPDVNVIASYVNESNLPIVPFAIEKHFSNGGSIVFVNAKGYFNEISKSPRKYFPSLLNISNMLHINLDRDKSIERSATPAIRYIGDLQLSGDIMLKSSSVLLGNQINNLSSIFAKRMAIFSNNEKQYNVFNNVSLKDLPVEAARKIIINSNGTLSLPDSASHNNYFSMSIPNGFNMTLSSLPNNSMSTEILNLNNSSLQLKHISKMIFYNITSKSAGLNSVPVLLKAPEIKVSGVSIFKSANIDGGLPSNASPLNITGFLNAKFDFVDNYEQVYSGGIKTQYITYLKSIQAGGTPEDKEIQVKLPGDISEIAKRNGVHVPWVEVMVSKDGIILLLSIISVSMVLLWRIRPNMKNRSKVS
jgi:hypothetical protein